MTFKAENVGSILTRYLPLRRVASVCYPDGPLECCCGNDEIESGPPPSLDSQIRLRRQIQNDAAHIEPLCVIVLTANVCVGDS